MANDVPDTVLKTQIIISDVRVCAIGHSSNRAACVAVSTAMQCFAAIARKLDLVEKVSFSGEGEDESPVYDVYLVPESDAQPYIKACISGLWVTLKGIAMQVPGSIEVHDSRKRNDSN